MDTYQEINLVGSEEDKQRIASVFAKRAVDLKRQLTDLCLDSYLAGICAVLGTVGTKDLKPDSQLVWLERFKKALDEEVAN